jgi:N-acetylglucosaminyldiphosphoundecaprenol N-acetyl-beta-D-mannosaminyltransferase
MIGAGGTVDFLAGRISRAPPWMRRTGTECIYRLCQEPRRLFKRYAGDLLQFVPALLAQLRHLPARSAKPSSTAVAPSATTTIYGIKVQTADPLQRDALQRTRSFWRRTTAEPGHCVIDLAGVPAIDSTGLAFLADWQRRLARVRRNLILLRPSAAVRAALARMHLSDQFVITNGTTPGPPDASARPGREAKPGPPAAP